MGFSKLDTVPGGGGKNGIFSSNDMMVISEIEELLDGNVATCQILGCSIQSVRILFRELRP